MAVHKEQLLEKKNVNKWTWYIVNYVCTSDPIPTARVPGNAFTHPASARGTTAVIHVDVCFPWASWHLHLLAAQCTLCFAERSPSRCFTAKITAVPSNGAPPYHVPVVDLFVVGNLSCSTENSGGVLSIILWEVLQCWRKVRAMRTWLHFKFWESDHKQNCKR